MIGALLCHLGRHRLEYCEDRPRHDWTWTDRRWHATTTPRTRHRKARR